MFKVLSTMLVCLGLVGVAQAVDKPFGERSVMSESSIAERVHRAGEVCKTGEECAGKIVKTDDAAPMEEEVLASGPRTGDVIYTSYCAGCHASGAAGSPKFGDAAAWDARLKKNGSEEALWQSAWSGIGIMPAKGMCMDCSEEEFAGAVAHIVNNSQ